MQRVKVISIDDGSAAKSHGIKVGDVLDRYNDIELTSQSALSAAAASATGDTILLNILRTEGRTTIAMPKGKLGIVVVDVDVDSDYFADVARNEQIRDVIVTTAPSAEGYSITKTVDIVSSEAVLGIGVISEFFASWTDTLGGRSKTIQSHLKAARETCVRELKEQAVTCGANGVIAVRFDFSEISGQGKSMLFVVATGTAVILLPARKIE